MPEDSNNIVVLTLKSNNQFPHGCASKANWNPQGYDNENRKQQHIDIECIFLCVCVLVSFSLLMGLVVAAS